MRQALAVAALMGMAGCSGDETEDPTDAAASPITCAIYEAAPDRLLCVCTDATGALVAVPPASDCVPPAMP